MSAALVLAFDSWPEADREMWQALFRRGSLLDEAGPLAHLREVSQQTNQRRYGRWLEWLRRSRPEALDEPPEARATPERLHDWLEALAHIAPASRHAFLNAVLWVLKAAAPDADWVRQKRLLAVASSQARKGQGARKQGRILSSAVLLDAGLHLAGPQADAESTPLRAAKARRDGAMVALLALMPMRRRAFLGLTLGSSFGVTPQGLHIRLSGDMTKSGHWWEAPVPKTVEPALRRYLDEVRPWFLARGGQAHDTLWIDNRGAPYEADYFGTRIRAITTRITGVAVSPHFFRDAAATTLSHLSPEHARLIRSLLGHASFETAERHYIHATGIEAGREYAGVVAALAASSRRG